MDDKLGTACKDDNFKEIILFIFKKTHKLLAWTADAPVPMIPIRLPTTKCFQMTLDIECQDLVDEDNNAVQYDANTLTDCPAFTLQW